MKSDTLQAHDAAADLTLLLVEDDVITSEMVLLRLGGLFKHVETVSNGLEGLRLFHELTPDIVLTDQNMPGLSGMEMIRQIRLTDQATPIILMTYSMDHETLVEAINLGVTKFIAKPFKYELFVRVFNDLIKDISNKRQQENFRLQEMELLRYRDKYNSMQQEAARHKERHVLRHDLRDQIISGSGCVNWSIEVVHSSKDTMCGDGYA
ncbi:MAG: response regulator [Desulfuromonadales bacterium]|nr:response regulator [Desulfuromonadales bacterium]